MARIRSIKPEFFRHHELYTLERATSLPVRVAFAGLWTAADKAGRFKWRPESLKLDCLPFDVLDFNDVLTALERGGFICRYEVDGVAYGCVRNWSKHQRPRNDEEASRLPAPPSSLGVDENPSLFSDESVTQQSLGKEGKGREEERKGGTPSASAARQEDVLVFPTDGSPSHWPLRATQVAEWQRAYPTLNVEDECTRALTWVQANQGHRKTANGMPRFLVNWLNRSTNGKPRNSTSGNGRVDDRPITAEERRRAEQVRRATGYCMHDPKCRSMSECIGRMVRKWREEEAAGMRGEE